MPQPSRAGLDLADRRGDKIVGSLLLATAPREVEGLRKRVPPTHAKNAAKAVRSYTDAAKDAIKLIPPMRANSTISSFVGDITYAVRRQFCFEAAPNA
jgi:hypothetical protein